MPDVSKCFANQFEVIDKDGTTVSGAVDATVAGLSTANVLSGYIGNIAQSNLNAQGDRPDTLQVFESSGKVRLTQVHGLNPPSPFKPGPLKGESWTNGCVSWTPNYLAKNVHTTSDVQLLTPAQTQNASR